MAKISILFATSSFKRRRYLWPLEQALAASEVVQVDLADQVEVLAVLVLEVLAASALMALVQAVSMVGLWGYTQEDLLDLLAAVVILRGTTALKQLTLSSATALNPSDHSSIPTLTVPHAHRSLTPNTLNLSPANLTLLTTIEKSTKAPTEAFPHCSLNHPSAITPSRSHCSR